MVMVSRVDVLNRTSISQNSKKVSFGRALREEEKPEYKKTVHEALDVLGIQNMALIMHGTSFPSVERDMGVGSPIGESAEKMVDFLDMNGFNSVQLGPGGKISRDMVSPYMSTVFTKNALFIDLKPLTEDKSGNLLSKETYEFVTKKSSNLKNQNIHNSNFNEAFENHDIAMREVFNNFNKKLKKKDPVVVAINDKFQKFKESNKFLEDDSTFEALALVNKTRDYTKWFDIDKKLTQYIKDEKNPKHNMALKRKEIIETTMSNEIEFYKFKQFLVNEQEKENADYRKEKDFKYIGDALIGFGFRDVWANQDAFLSDWAVGAPYGGVENGPQTWDIPLVNPKKLFKEDGSLGVSGQLLKKKFDTMLDTYDNIRIDHALGVVDPWIYKKDTVVKSDGNAVDRAKLHSGNISQINSVDPNGNYKKVLDKIIIPTLKEHGVNPNELIWEDLGTDTETFTKIYREEFKLPGLTQTLWSRGEGTNPDNWTLITSHDSGPLTTESWHKEDADSWNPAYLSGYLMADDKYKDEKHPILGYSRNEYKKELEGSNFKKAKAKFVELFRSSNNIQMNFVDLFGINATYNKAGTEDSNNWRLRVNNNFEDVYYKNLEKDDYKNIIINMPETLEKAVVAKDMKAVEVSDNKDSTRDNLSSKHKDLLARLEKYAKILKEPSDK